MKLVSYSAVLILLACCSVSTGCPAANNAIDTANWMAQLSDSTPLNRIIMPGSHDAGMSQTRHCTFVVKSEWAQTQSLSVGGQEQAGSRYFDIRVDYDHGSLTTYHRTGGVGGSGESVKDILDQTMAFLDAHKTETVILKFSHTRDDNSHHKQDTVRRVVDFILSNPNYKRHLFTSSSPDITSATLNNLRGKLVAVFDQKDYQGYINPANGVFGYNDFPYNNHFAFNVFDQFSDSTDFGDMKADQFKKLANNGGFGKHYLFLLSWTLTGKIFHFNLKELADKVNPELTASLHQAFYEAHLPKANIVYLDFINADLANSIISYNFQQISPYNLMH